MKKINYTDENFECFELKKEKDPEFIDIDGGFGFSLKEAFEMLNREVNKIQPLNLHKTKNTNSIGLVVGILTMNGEVEIVLNFFNEMHQLTKHEFLDHFELAPE